MAICRQLTVFACRGPPLTLYPLPISPTMFAAGTRTSSKDKTQVDDALIPSYTVSSTDPAGEFVAETHLGLLLRNLDAHILAQDETGDALVSL